MNMNKKLLASAIAAALGVTSFSALAATTLPVNGVPATNDYAASELDIEVQPTLDPDGAGFLQITSNLGVALPDSKDNYIRLDLSNGATFATAAVVAADLTFGAATVGLIGGGKVGDSFVIFSISNTTGAAITGDTDFIVDFTAAEIEIANTNTVNVTYRLYETSTQATNPDVSLTLVKSENNKYITFDTSYDLSTTEGAAAVAEVTKDFLEFKTGTDVTTTTAKLGVITLEEGASGLALTDTLTADTALLITGDFTALASAGGIYDTAAESRLFLEMGGATSDCSVFDSGTDTPVDAGELTAESATITIGNTGLTDVALCFITNSSANGVNMPTSTYKVALVPVGASPYTNESNPGIKTVGSIERNGTVLLSPFFTNTVGYVPRFYLSNVGSSDAKFTVKLQSDPLATGLDANGNCTINPASPYVDCVTNAADCTIGAGENKLIKAPDLVSAGQRCAAIFSIAASNDDVHGIFQQRYSVSGDFDSYLMISIGSTNGH